MRRHVLDRDMGISRTLNWWNMRIRWSKPTMSRKIIMVNTAMA